MPAWLLCKRLRIGQIAAKGRTIRRLSNNTKPSDKDNASESDFRFDEYLEKYLSAILDVTKKEPVIFVDG